MNLQAKHPLCPLHAEVVDGAGVQGRHGLRVIQQLPPHQGDVPVQGDLDVGAVTEVVAPGGVSQRVQLAVQPVRDDRDVVAAAGRSSGRSPAMTVRLASAARRE